MKHTHAHSDLCTNCTLFIQVQMNSWIFLLAGFETSSTALGYLAHALCQNPEVQVVGKWRLTTKYQYKCHVMLFIVPSRNILYHFKGIWLLTIGVPSISRCVHASLQEGVTVGPSVGAYNAFVPTHQKWAKRAAPPQSTKFCPNVFRVVSKWPIQAHLCLIGNVNGNNSEFMIFPSYAHYGCISTEQGFGWLYYRKTPKATTFST